MKANPTNSGTKNVTKAARPSRSRTGMTRADRKALERLSDFGGSFVWLTPNQQDEVLEALDAAISRAAGGLGPAWSRQSLTAANEIDRFNEPLRIRLMEAVQRIGAVYRADPSSRRPEPTPARDLGPGVIDLQARRGR